MLKRLSRRTSRHPFFTFAAFQAISCASAAAQDGARTARQRGRCEMGLYMKTVFTVIAIALSVIAWQDLKAGPAQAQTSGITHVVICDGNNAQRCVGVTDKGQLDVLAHPG
jgi:hypothetical protein